MGGGESSRPLSLLYVVSWDSEGGGVGTGMKHLPSPIPNPTCGPSSCHPRLSAAQVALEREICVQFYCETFYEGHGVLQPPQNSSGALGKSLSETQLLYAESNDSTVQ